MPLLSPEKTLAFSPFCCTLATTQEGSLQDQGVFIPHSESQHPDASRSSRPQPPKVNAIDPTSPQLNPLQTTSPFSHNTQTPVEKDTKMIPTVRFLEVSKPNSKVWWICQQTRQLYEQHRQILIHVANPAQAEFLDERLWTFAQDCFIPHATTPCDVSLHPVVIASEELPVHNVGALIQGEATSIEYARQFPLVIDFAEVYDSQKREQSRERFRLWKTLGVQPVFEKPEQHQPFN